MGAAVVRRGQHVVQQAQDVARAADSGPHVEVALLGIDRGVGGIVDRGLRTEVHVVLVRVDQVGVLQVGVEVGGDVVDLDEVEFQRVKLVEEVASAVPVVAEREGGNVARVLRPALPVEGARDLRVGDGNLEPVARQAQEPREEQRSGGCVLVGMGVVVQPELEVAAEAERELFAAAEDVLVRVGNRRGHTQQAGRVERALKPGLDALQVRFLEFDGAVHQVRVALLQADVHAAEERDAREAGIGGADVGFVVGFALFDLVEIEQERGLYPELSDRFDVHVAEGVSAVGPGGGRGFVAGVILQADRQLGRSVVGRGIGKEEEMVLGKPVIAPLAEEAGQPLGFGLQGLLGEAVAHLEPQRIGLLREDAVHLGIADDIADLGETVAVARVDAVGDGGLAVFLLRADIRRGAVESQILHVAHHPRGAFQHQRGVVDHRRIADALHDPVPARSAAGAPVVDIEPGIPLGIGLLAQVRGQVRRFGSLLALGEDDPVLRQARRPLRQHPRGGAGCRRKGE